MGYVCDGCRSLINGCVMVYTDNMIMCMCTYMNGDLMVVYVMGLLTWLENWWMYK